MQRARRGGGGSPKSRRWETRSTTQRPRAEGQRIIQPSFGVSLALAPRRGGSGIVEAFLNREREPQTPPRRAFWGNDFHWTLGGHISHNAPKGAARRGWCLFLCRF